MPEKKLVEYIFKNIDLLKETLLFTWDEDLVSKIKSDIESWELQLSKIEAK